MAHPPTGITVSSKDQSLERQIAVAHELGVGDEYLFIEKASGKDFKRPEYQLLKRMLREGDILYISISHLLID
jgi:DNA invertase Pin-like site-specific DNA recombinase